MKKIFIVGMPGSGKSTMAKYLSSETSFKYLDLDEEIELKSKKSVSKIFEIDGEESFRVLEKETLDEIIQKEEKFILATGGGTPSYDDNMEKMNKNGITIFLNTSPEILIERISRKNKRPLFNSTNVREKVSKIFDERIKFYKRSKHTIINNNREKALSIINSYS
tara:strand:- start:2727 stop:3221 length:495 start_codon:yes stop_codon:yes gene_type:complete